MDVPDPTRLMIISDAKAGAHTSPGDEKHLEVLNELTSIANLDLELRPMLQRITDTLIRHFDWQLVALVVADREGSRFVCEAMSSSLPTDVHVGYSRPLGTGVVGEVVATKLPVLVDDVRLHANYIDTTPGVLSEICVPIEHKGKVVAVLNIESTRLSAFHGRLPLLQMIAGRIAATIGNARLYAELEERARLMQMMSEVSRSALEATHLDDFLARVVSFVYERFPLEIVSIRLYDAERLEYYRAAEIGNISRRSASNRWSVGQGIIGRCLRTGHTQLVRDVTTDPDYICGTPTVVSELVVPIQLQGELLGVFNLESSAANTFTAATVMAVEAFADQIAGGLKMVRTNDELAAAKSELDQQKRDLEDANALLASAVETLHEVSAQDSLTGLHTRRHFDHMIGIEWRRAGRMDVPLSLLIADIDGFKPYNDVLGHPAGDKCLKRVADAIRSAVQRAGDVVARYGGEEFAILLPDTDGEKAGRLAESIRERVAALQIHHPAGPAGSSVTLSIGVATSDPDGDGRKTQTLIDHADHALYQAKRSGRNRVVVYAGDMEPRGKKYSAPGIEVYFDPRSCIHAAACVSGLPGVFNPKLKPWIRPENATPEKLAEVIALCPTGALHYVRRDGGSREPIPQEDAITLVAGGPLYVHGDVTVELHDGTLVRKDTRMALCRCGHSQSRPFCDNSHTQVTPE